MAYHKKCKKIVLKKMKNIKMKIKLKEKEFRFSKLVFL